MVPLKPIVILGAGGHAVSVAEAATACGFEVLALVGEVSTDCEIGELTRVSVISELQLRQGIALALGVGNPALRHRLMSEIGGIGLNSWPPIVHPSASIAGSATLSSASVVLQGSVVGAQAQVGVGSLINSNATLEHHGVMHDFSSLEPGVVTGGAVQVGKFAIVGMGSTVARGISIGEGAVVGAASLVLHDVPSFVTAFGSPARISGPSGLRIRPTDHLPESRDR